MAVIKGNNVSLYYKAEPTNNSSDITTLSGYADLEGVTSCSISVSNATYEVDFKDVTPANAASAPSLSATRAYAVGTTTATVSVEGVYDASLTDNAEEMFDLCQDKTRVGIFWSGSGDGAETEKALGGVGFCTSFELSGGVNDFVTFSASFELTGDPTIVNAA